MTRVPLLLGLVLLALASAASGQERITAWPLLYHVSDEKKAETDILWPLLRYERNETYTKYAFRPFVFSTESDPAKDFRKTSVLWPLSLYEHDQDEDWFHVFPVYWQASGKDYAWRNVWPLFGVRHRGASFTEYSTVWPLFTYGSDAAGAEVSVSAPWPLIHYERAGDTVAHRVLPLYWYEGDPSGSGGFVLPYFWSTAPDHALRGLFPLWLSYDAPMEHADLFVPFYFRDREAGADLMFVTPLYFQRRTPDSQLRGLLPLYVGYEAPASALRLGLPVYAHYRSNASAFSVVLPVYFHSSDASRDSEFTYYFPLYGRYRRGEAVSRHYFLFPLYGRFEDRALQLAGWDALWPLLHHESSPSSVDTRVLPLFWHSRSPDHDWTFALLYGEMASGETENAWLVPFYLHRATPQVSLTLGTLALLPPYYVDRRDATSSQFHVWPFYGRDREGGYTERSVIWPLFRSGSSDDGRRERTQALLYYSARDGDEASWSLIPLWYHARSPARTVDGSLLLHWYEREPPAGRTRWAVLWLFPPEASLVQYESTPDASEFRFLWRFVHRREAPDRSLFEFNPFYYHEREGKGDYWNILGGLVGKRTHEDGSVTMQWLWFL